MQLARTLNNPIARVTLMTLFCYSLSGCAVAIKSTNLDDVPTKPEEARLLKSVGYVFHDEAYVIRGKNHLEIEKQYIESERKSWIEALSSFTDQENIFTMSDGKPFSMINSFPEFAKTHPIVDVYIKAVPEKQGITTQDVYYITPTIVSFITFGMIPAYIPLAYTASFTLSMPEEKHASSAHWDYLYDRQEYYWLPILRPMTDYYDYFSAENDAESSMKAEERRHIESLWKTEEKRRLVLRFLQDAKTLLQEH